MKGNVAVFKITCFVFLSCWTGYVSSSPTSSPPPNWYVIEHEISSANAKNAALTTDIKSLIEQVGCQECTEEEISYCLGDNVIADHCCCDLSYAEPLSFVLHTCYIGSELCKPFVRDCAEYERRLNCCCNKLLLKKWKKKFSSSAPSVTNKTILLLLLPILNFLEALINIT